MLLLDPSNTAGYLRERGWVGVREEVRVEELSGGVSNVVLLVTRGVGEAFVVKQAREQLRVPEPWFCGVERIWREVEVLRVCERVLGGMAQSGDVRVAMPRVLFEDREEFAFAMTAAAFPHETLKTRLLRGVREPALAEACGRLLGRLHAGTWGRAEESLADQSFFDALRIDPYYRRVAEVRPELAGTIGELIASLDVERHCLVHGDYSPKNLLVSPSGDFSRLTPAARRGSAEGATTLTLIDCEVGHFGDPAFDLGFFLTHLVLKAIGPLRGEAESMLALAEVFLLAYQRELEQVVGGGESAAAIERAYQNLAGCMFARVDGKSRVEYLPQAEQQEAVRRIARRIFAERPRDWQGVYSIVVRTLSL